MDTAAPQTPAVEHLWQEQDLKLAQEISIWGLRLLDTWPPLDHEIEAWTERMICLLRLSYPSHHKVTVATATAPVAQPQELST